MPLYPLGISRCRDIPRLPRQATGAVNMCWGVAGELACAFIDAPHQAVPPMLHATALEAIHRRICVLPVRFGVAVSDEAEIRSLLQIHRDELLDHLNRLDSTCEMGLRIRLPSLPERRDAASSEPQSPLGYLEGRRSHFRKIDANMERDGVMFRQFVEPLHGCYREWRNLQPSPSHPIRLAFLVERDRVAAFQSRAENARKTHLKGKCVVLGPWPPYSFV
jgi:hypothetical protein